jgi:calcineurin-like phosphoesterase family protein/purple acid phosphatase-like protein/PKD domain-containing protein
VKKRRGILLVLGMAIAYVFAVPPALAQSVSRGPYLQMGSPTSVVIRWRTGSATNSRVRFGTSLSSLTGVVDVSTSTTEHQVRLTGLTPDTRYFYSVGSTTQVQAGGDPLHFFRTPPNVGTRRPYRIWVLGDSGTADSSQRAVRDAYNTFNGNRYTDLWLMLGDNAYDDGTDAEYQAAVFDIYPKWLRQSVLWPTLGNHDGHSASSSSLSGPYYNIFTLPRAGEAGGVNSGTEAYYSFDFGNIHFICLNSQDVSRSTSGAMLTWLRQDLQNNTRDWTIAFWHHPPYSKGSHDSDDESQLVDMRRNALPILESEGVDLVLAGHSHSYERSYLLDGHYGSSSSLTGAMKLDSGNGRSEGNGAYSKPTLGPGTHEGAVYVVAGTSGKTAGGSLNHPAMFLSLNTLGSLVIDVNGSQLTAQFLNSSGSVRDHFTIVKSGTPGPQAGFSASPTSGPAPLQVQFSNLSTGATSWAWDFDANGTTDSTQPSPAYTYSTPGTYTVRLTATSSTGSDVLTKTGHIVVSSAQAMCGNGIREGTEVCDGTQLNGETCQSLGFSSGTLHCRANCSGFDITSCVPGPPPQWPGRLAPGASAGRGRRTWLR